MPPGGGQAFGRIARRAVPGAELLRAWPLEGGVSARTTALEIARPDGRRDKLVVREQGGVPGPANPHLAARDEVRLLAIVGGAGVPVPAPCYADDSGELLSRPYVVVAFAGGEPGQQASPRPPGLGGKLAAALASIHRVPFPQAGLAFLGDKTETFGRRLRQEPARLDEALSEGRIRAALRQVWPPPRHNQPALLHGDFWPGNTLWRRGEITAVIDWEDAGCGDPLADLANGRLEIAMLFGAGVMAEFTRQYRALRPDLDYTGLPCWDLCAALRPAGQMAGWGLTPAGLARLRRGHRSFADQALRTLQHQ